MDNYEHSQICQSFSEILTSGKLGFAKNTNLQFLEPYSAFIIMTSSKIIDIQLNYIMKNDIKVFSTCAVEYLYVEHYGDLRKDLRSMV